MAGKITGFFREFKLIFSIIMTILGFIILFIGISGMWLKDLLDSVFAFFMDYTTWSLYLLIIGFIVFGMGVWYLYTYILDKKFILEEIKTNKRSEFLKKHSELKNAVRHMPSKYRKMLKDKENELKIK